MSMKNETAIITGSTSGIGKKIAEVFLKEGCKVAICSRNEERVKKTISEFKEKYGESVLGQVCDVTKLDDLRSLAEKTLNAFGSIRILVANAGLNTIYGPFEYLSAVEAAQNAQFVIGVNLIGTINSVNIVLPYMIDQGYGRIITLAGAGTSRPTPYMTLYSASKGGVVTFSRCLAEELKERDDDIKINIYLPGMIKTNLEKNTKVLEEWKDEETFRRESSIVFAHIGANIDDSSKKVIPYVLPSCKKNGEQFKGFSMLKMIRGGMKLRGALKDSQ